MPGESDLIHWITSQQKTDALVRLPAGDDLAILQWPDDDLLLVGTDQLLDGRHFLSATTPPELIGQKAMNRNLSDCAAMGVLPAAAVVTLALPASADIDYAKRLYTGIKLAADPYYCRIVGGDTASWAGPLAISIAILARPAGLKPIRRDTAQPGDFIHVTGPLGGSILGRHLTFTPRIPLGRQLANFGPTGYPVVSAMLDISDGLSRDLPRLLQNNNLGALIDASAIPIHPDAHTLSATTGQSPLHHALHDGEDYELLFASPVRPPIGTRIGRVTATPGIQLKHPDGSTTPLEPLGWDHKLGATP
jgi:thiamine-monophosphate kinase